METFNISLPTSWDELTDKQLLMVYGLFARDLSAAEVKTLCLMKWNHLKLLATLPDKRSIMKKEGEQVVVLSVRQIQQATTVLDFLDCFPPMPVRIAQIGKHHALPADFEKVPFEQYLYVDNLFQGYLHTQQEELLLQMAQVLYGSDSVKPSKAHWWACSTGWLLSSSISHSNSRTSINRRQPRTMAMASAMNRQKNFSWNATAFFESLDGFEEALAKMQTKTAFVCVSDISQGFTDINNTPHTRRVKTVFLAMRHAIDNMEARQRCMDMMRDLFRQYMSVLILEQTRLEQHSMYIDPRISFQEIDRYFFSGCACAYFQIAVDTYTDLQYNEDEWTE